MFAAESIASSARTLFSSMIRPRTTLTPPGSTSETAERPPPFFGEKAREFQRSKRRRRFGSAGVERTRSRFSIDYSQLNRLQEDTR